jgi:hypothetical protein
VDQQFRDLGGNAFVKLTGLPTTASVAALAKSGLKPPVGCARVWGTECTAIMTFDSLGLASVWGNIQQMVSTELLC